jgi:serine/threonine-protein kinase
MADRWFGRYRLERLLGKATMGAVWLARDSRTERLVVVRILPSELISDTELRAGFDRRIGDLASLAHPKLVQIHEWGEVDGQYYIDTELLDGTDLRTILRGGAVPAVRAIEIVESVASALDAAHRIGLVHGDVQPENIFVQRSGQVCLLNLGLAHDPGTPAVDIRGLACVLYECLTGRWPSGASTLADDGIAPALVPVLTRGISPDGSDPFASAGELVEAAAVALGPTVKSATQARSSAADRGEGSARDTAVDTSGGRPDPAVVMGTRDGEVGSTLAAQQRRTKRRMLLVLSVVAFVFVVAIGAFTGWRLTRTEPANPGMAFNGRFSVTETQRPAPDLAFRPPFTIDWVVTTHCPAATGTCTALTERAASDGVINRIVDYRDGKWTAAWETTADCNRPNGTEDGYPVFVEQVFTVDGTTGRMMGTHSILSGGTLCRGLATYDLAGYRIGDVDKTTRTEPPTKLEPRVEDPPGAAISGMYDVVVSLGGPGPAQAPISVRTRYRSICLRTGDRCLAAPDGDSPVILPAAVFHDTSWHEERGASDFKCYESPDSPTTQIGVTTDLHRTDGGDGLARSVAGTLTLTSGDPCVATYRGTVQMTRIGD